MDSELLQAIQLMIDPLKNDMQDMKSEMQDMKSDIKDIKERLTNVEEETRRTSLIVENKIEPALQALAEGYMPLVDKVRHVPEEIENLKDTVSLLDFVQKQLVKKVQNI